MKLALIGLGQAGGKISERIVDYDVRTDSGIVMDCIAVNTAEQDLHGLDSLPPEKRVLIGETEVKGNGVGADNELGAEVAQRDISEVMNAVDGISTHEIDAFMLIAGLGGGTGSGSAPVVAKHLQRLYSEPVYCLGVLPSTDEGGVYTLNAARSFQTVVEHVDNLIVFDNDAWRQGGESLEEGFEHINEEIARRFGIVFGAGEFQEGQEVAQSVVDASEVINTLKSGGISTIGYASDEVDSTGGGLLDRFRSTPKPDATETTNRLTGLVRKSTLGQLTLPANVESTERALLVTAGPPSYLTRKGVEKGRKWLESETDCMEVRGGDYPLPQSDHVACAVLLSGVHDVPRIKELQEVAIEASERIKELRESSDEKLDSLVESGSDDDLGPLF